MGIDVIATDSGPGRRLAVSVVLGQTGVTLGLALLCWLIADRQAAISAALGGGISAAASLAMALLGFRANGADPLRILRSFFVGEAAKIAVTIVLFVAVLRSIKVVPLAMLGAYAATFLVFWVALANAMEPWRGAPRRPEAGDVVDT